MFRGWPAKAPDLGLKPAGDKTHDGVRLRAWDFTSEEGVELRLWLMTAGDETADAVVLNALDEADWNEWCADLGPEFAEVLQLTNAAEAERGEVQAEPAVMEQQKWAFAAVCPRGIGPTKWAEPGSPNDIQNRRRFALVGQTLDGHARLGRAPGRAGLRRRSTEGRADLAAGQARHGRRSPCTPPCSSRMSPGSTCGTCRRRTRTGRRC